MNSDIPYINSHAEKQINNIREVCERIKPLVVIACITYNHEAYLRDALNGFVMQKTDFPFVAIVHDDASTDNTAKIIKESAEKYPNIILPIYEKENQYSKKNGNPAGIMRSAIQATGAKYIALCEGDDYWTDQNKLQIQIDLMQKDPKITLSFHSVLEKYESSPNTTRIRKLIENREYSGLEWFKTRPAQTASFLIKSEIFRSELYNQVKNDKRFIVGDIPLLLVCAHYGKIYGISDIMSVYRHNQGGWTSTKKTKSEQWEIIKMQDAYCLFGEEYYSTTRSFVQRDCVGFFIANLKRGKLTPQFLIHSLKISIGGTIKSLFNVLRKKYV